jgi:hypothetical protein
MSQTTLIPPDSHTKPPATTLENKEQGWSFKRIVDSINTMFTELYLNESNRAASEAARSPIQFVDVTVSSAELLALFTTAKTLVPAPGANFSLVFESIVIHKPAGTAYAGIAAGEDLTVKMTSSAGAVLATIEATGFLDQATAQTRQAQGYRAASGVNDTTPSNNAIVLHMLTGEITTGNTGIICRVYYRVIPTVLA